jgi:pyruvate/2-oxoglutarate/acetoin dehydrogenase E1 component
VVDLRSLRPFDLETILASVSRTNRVVIVEEGPELTGWGSTLAGVVSQTALEELDDLLVISTPSIPVPYSPPLEDAFMRDGAHIAAAIRERLGVEAAHA